MHETPPPPNGPFSLECAAFFAEMVQIFGLPPSVGQIYGLLFASPRALSFTDIYERLEISKGSASQGLQFLRALGAVRAVRENGDGRREYFEAELSLRQLVSGVLRERVMPLASASGTRMAGLRELARRDAMADGFCLDRVAQLDTWRRRLRTVLPVLTALLGPKKIKS